MKTPKTLTAAITSTKGMQPELRQLPKWDGVKRIDTFFSVYCGAERSKHNKDVARKMFAAIINRIFNPGCIVDHVVVLVGKQGLRKGELCRVLALKDEWFGRHVAGEDIYNVAHNTYGKIITEIEQGSFRGMDIGDVKSYLVRQYDRVRPPYTRNGADYPRTGIFIATQSGNKRNWGRNIFLDNSSRLFLKVQLSDEPIDIALLKQHVKQLYAEAISLYLEKESK